MLGCRTTPLIDLVVYGIMKIENKQGSPDIKKDPAVVSILIFRVRRGPMGQLG